MVNPEALARMFHETYERLAPHFGYTTRPESAVPWADIAPNLKALMIETARQVGAELATEYVFGLEPRKVLPDEWEVSGAVIAVRATDVDGVRRTALRYAGDVEPWEAAGMLRAAVRENDRHLDLPPRENAL